MQSAFDADTFLGTSYQEKGETHFTPVPGGKDYTAMIGANEGDIRVRSGVDDEGRTWARLDINWEIDSDELRDLLHRDRVTVRQSLWLDVKGSPPRLAWGTNQNVKLGKVREAVGQNDGGDWSILNLLGAGPAYIHVVENPDKDDPDVVYNDVTRVVKAV